MTNEEFRRLKEGDVIEVNGNYLDGKHKVFNAFGKECKPDFGNIRADEKFYVSNCAEVEKHIFCAIAFKNPSFIGEFIVIYEYFHEWFSLIDKQQEQ